MNAFIYAIKNETSNDVYIGSTVRTLGMRISEHRTDYDLYLKNKCHYMTSFQIIKCKTNYIEYIEGCDINDMDDREKFWIKNTPNCINKKNNTKLSRKEWRKLYDIKKKITQDT